MTLRTTTKCKEVYIDVHLGFLTNFKIVALPHTNTVISQGSYFNTSQSLGLL